jgi:hypothetical protein
LNYLVKNNNKSITNLSERLDRLSGGSGSTSDYVIKNIGKGSGDDVHEYWKGRKIIPLNEWKKIANTNYAFGHGVEHMRTKEAFKYLPDDYSAHLFLLGVPNNAREEVEIWLSDYLDLMEFKKNANYGKTKCSGCLLDPEMDGNPIFHGFNRLVAKGLVVIADIEKQEKEGEEGGEEGKREENKDEATQTLEIDETNGKAIKEDDKKLIERHVPYPCSVYNRFECLYEKGKVKIGENANFDVNTLFYLAESVAFPMELAFSHMKSICVNKGLVFEADFVNGKVKEQEFDYYGNPFPYAKEFELEEGLSKVQRPAKIRVTDATEMYNTLTDVIWEISLYFFNYERFFILLEIISVNASKSISMNFFPNSKFILFTSS